MAGKLGIHPGFRRVSDNLLEAAIMSILADHYLKGNEESVKIGDIADVTCSTIAEVQSAFDMLQDQGLVDDPGTPWPEVSSFYVQGIGFKLAREQGMLTEEAPAETEQGPRGDRERGFDYQPVENDVYYAEISEKGNKTFLRIYRIQVDGALTLDTLDGETLNAELEVEQKVADREAAWTFFDEWLAAKQPAEEQPELEEAEA